LGVVLDASQNMFQYPVAPFWGRIGKPVKRRCGPAAVSEDETRRMPLNREGWRSGSGRCGD